MAGIGAGFGAFADGMSAGYMMGKQLKNNQAENKPKEQEQRNVGTGVQNYADTHDILGMDQAVTDAQQEQYRATEAERQRQTEELRNDLTQQQPSQQGAGMDPSMGMGAMQAFGGSSAAGGEAAAGGGSAAGGSSAVGSGVAAAGPWAALAAIIAVNEKSARNGGHRRDGADYAKDLATGKVLSQDVNERWVPKLGGYDNDKTGLLHDAGAGAEFASLDFKSGLKKLADGGTAKTVLNGIKKLF